MIYLLIAAIIGAIVNRIRGGWLLPSNHGTFNILAFGLFILLLTTDNVGTTAEGVPYYANSTGDFLLAAMAMLAMWFGESWGWGRYIGALGGWENNPLREVSFIDDYLLWIKKRITSRAVAGSPHKRGGQIKYNHTPLHLLRLWGFLGMTLRGGLWGGALSLVLLSLWPLLFGLTMGLCYLAAIEACRLYGKPHHGWEAGEVLFGAVLWVSIALVFV